MAHFSFDDYLVNIINNPSAAPAAKAAALDEFKRRDDLNNTLPWLIALPIAGVLISALGGAFLAQGSFWGAVPAVVPNAWQRVAPYFNGALTTMLWSLAWYVAGWLAGFLFGIPKTGQGDLKPGAGQAPDYRQQVNTNLEQISDWLTKIIVGIGLIQLRNLPSYVVRMCAFMGSEGCGIQCHSFAAALMISFIILGFLTGYLLTRLYLASAFFRAAIDGSSNGVNATERVLKTPVGPGTSTPSADDEKAADTALNPTPGFDDFGTRWARSKAKLIQQNYLDAVVEYARLVSEQPNNIEILLEYAWALFKHSAAWTPEIQDQLNKAYALDPKPGSDLRKQLVEAITFYTSYRDPPEGYLESIRVGEEYIANSKNVPSAEVYLNLACAYGQQAKNTPEAERKPIRDKALDAAKKAIALNGNSAKVLRSQLLAEDSNEDDLKLFQRDNEFRKLLSLPLISS